jgi:hypothetical protein
MKFAKCALLMFAAVAMLAVPAARSAHSALDTKIQDISGPGPLADISGPGPLADISGPGPGPLATVVNV